MFLKSLWGCDARQVPSLSVSPLFTILNLDCNIQCAVYQSMLPFLIPQDLNHLTPTHLSHLKNLKKLIHYP